MDAAGQAELHEVTIQRAPETGECRCLDPACPFREDSTGHSQVMAMQAHAAQHAMTTGHRVAECSRASMVVGPRAGLAA